MLLDTPVEFPGQELKKSLDNIQGLLDAAKPLAEQLLRDEKVKEAIIKCVEALQVLLSQTEQGDENWRKKIEDETMKDLDQRQNKRKNKRNGTITPEDETPEDEDKGKWE